MSKPGSNSVGTNLPTSCPIFRATLKAPPAFKVLQPHPETQPALSGRAVKPN